MTIDEAVAEWQSKKRRMGCVSASDWFCKRVKGFWPERLDRYTEDGYLFQHVLATNGIVRIDLAPYSDAPRDPSRDIVSKPKKRKKKKRRE